MRVSRHALGFTLALGFGLGLGGGCAASGGKATSAGTGGTGNHTGMGGTTLTGSGGAGIPDADVPDGLGACTTFTAQAQQAPAALLIVLQRSSSMINSGKWPAAQSAIVQAIDEDVFDTMSLGFAGFPSGYTGAPDCLCPGLGSTCSGLLPNGVACGFPMTPQISIVPAGTQKSTASSGVRRSIAGWLNDAKNGPEQGDPSNATPMYDTLVGGYEALAAVPNVDKRILILVSDGGGSCTSLSNRTSSAISDGMCPDWESPLVMRDLIAKAETDPSTPIETLIVGVPGSNSHGETVGLYTTAPYSMLLALSTYAAAGSPSTIDPTCDEGLVWSQSGAAPAHPCHIDLSGGTFNAAALANAIASLRGKALGCVYPLPAPPAGQTLDPGKVNVVVTIDGTPYTIPKRSNPQDTCTSAPCWDYDANQNVVLIGIACSTVSTSASAAVDIYGGCATILK